MSVCYRRADLLFPLSGDKCVASPLFLVLIFNTRFGPLLFRVDFFSRHGKTVRFCTAFNRCFCKPSKDVGFASSNPNLGHFGLKSTKPFFLNLADILILEHNFAPHSGICALCKFSTLFVDIDIYSNN